MNPGLFTLGAVSLIAFALTLHDDAVRAGATRVLGAAGWPLLAALYVFLFPDNMPRLLTAATIAAACIATLGRPGLLLHQTALTEAARADAGIRRQRMVGGVAVALVALTAFVIWSWLG